MIVPVAPVVKVTVPFAFSTAPAPVTGREVKSGTLRVGVISEQGYTRQRCRRGVRNDPDVVGYHRRIIHHADRDRHHVGIGQLTATSVMTKIVGDHCQRIAPAIVGGRGVRDVGGKRCIDLRDRPSQGDRRRAIPGETCATAYGRGRNCAMPDGQRHRDRVCAGVRVDYAKAGDRLRGIFVGRLRARHRVHRAVVHGVDDDRHRVVVGERAAAAAVTLIVRGHRQRVGAVIVRRRRIDEIPAKRRVDLRDRSGQRHGGGAVVGDCGIACRRRERAMRDRERDGQAIGCRIRVGNTELGDELGRILVHR